jgi:hypothetical protein
MRFIPSTEGPQVATRRGVTVAEHEATRAALRSAGDLVAEHTGHPEYAIADRIADALNDRGHRLTTADRIVIANEVRQLHDEGFID